MSGPLQAALLGTGRTPAPPPPDELQAAHNEDATTERNLLRAAFADAVLRRAAAPLPSRPAPTPAPAETRPLCDPRHVGLLRDMTDGPYGAVLADWLRRLAITGTVIRPEMVTRVLDAGSTAADLAALALPVLSERARWLTRTQDPDGLWEWVGEDDPEQTWQVGARPARIALLAHLRRTDPAAGRELLATTFAEEPARDRETFLALLAEGLGPDDVPLLEVALEGRSGPVREQAHDLLARLPDSAFAHRMAVRLRDVVTVKRRALGAGELVVELPDDALIAELVADGAPNPKRPTGGRRAHMLAVLVGAAPLSVWTELTGRPAAKTSRMGVADNLRDVLQSGWQTAAARQRDAEWAAAVAGLDHDRGVRLDLLAEVAPEAVEDALRARLKELPHAPYGLGLDTGTREWSLSFTRDVVAALSGAPSPETVAGLVREVGTRGHLDFIADLEHRLGRLDPEDRLAAPLRDALAVLTFRRSVADLLPESP